MDRKSVLRFLAVFGILGWMANSIPLSAQVMPSGEQATPPGEAVAVVDPSESALKPALSADTPDAPVTMSLTPITVQAASSVSAESPSSVEVVINENRGKSALTSSTPAENARRSITIMSNVLDHLLSEQLGEDYRARGVFSSGCRGYWIPDSGALFLLEVKFPLQDLKAPSEPQGSESQKDLWEQYEEKLSGEAPPLGLLGKTMKQEKVTVNILSGEGWFSGKVKYDPEKVEKLKKAVLTALAQYGHRLQEIPEDGLVTVIADSSAPEFGFGALPLFESRIEPRAEETDLSQQLENAKQRLEELQYQFHNRQQYLDVVKQQLDLANDRVKRIEQLFQTGRGSQAELDEVQQQALESQKTLLEAENSLRETEHKMIQAEKEYANLKRRQELEQAKAEIGKSQKQSREDMQSKVDTLREQARVFKELMDVNAEKQEKKETKIQHNQDLRDLLNVEAAEGKPMVGRLMTREPGADLERSVSTMILRVPFKDLPKTKGEAQDLEGKVKIDVY